MNVELFVVQPTDEEMDLHRIIWGDPLQENNMGVMTFNDRDKAFRRRALEAMNRVVRRKESGERKVVRRD